MINLINSNKYLNDNSCSLIIYHCQFSRIWLNIIKLQTSINNIKNKKVCTKYAFLKTKKVYKIVNL